MKISKKAYRFIPFLFLFLTVACVGEDFPPSAELNPEEPQVLAIKAEPPEISPGETAGFESLVWWPETDISRVWLLCVPLPYEDLNNCVKNYVERGGELIDCQNIGSQDNACILTQDATASIQLDYPIPFGGESYQIIVEMVVSDQEDAWSTCKEAIEQTIPNKNCLISGKRLIYSNTEDNNLNPVISYLTLDGSPITEDTQVVNFSNDIVLGVKIDADYIDEIPENPEEEIKHYLEYSWYFDCGKMERYDDTGEITDFGTNTREIICKKQPGDSEVECSFPQNYWKPEKAGNCVIYGVLRDNSGGIDYIVQNFLVE
ncbi:MAG: hypothetical protein PF689_00910 [Deltaproteobacteria bacterium]|jgi:hypothetical protein|nr:hypothetical protein [Deltaproteobacteria bacterium]